MPDGFIGTAAPFYIDAVLGLELAMGVALLTGAFLARLGKYRAHARCQAAVVLLNSVVVVFVMLPSFHRQVWPRIPQKLGKSYYALAASHAALGVIVECAAVYILLAAGTTVLPEKFRLTRYKLWMRTLLAAWWVVLFLGAATYVRWYVPNVFPR